MRRVIIVAITAVLASLVGWAPAVARTCPRPPWAARRSRR